MYIGTTIRNVIMVTIMTKENKMVISDKQLAFLKSKGTAYELSKLSGVSFPTVHDFMNKKRFMDTPKLKKLCDVLGVPLSEFFAMGEGKNITKH